MRIIYMMISSSMMIGLMLLFRRLFRNKLSANVIYAFWLIVLFRLIVPLGYWDIPLFGTAAEFAYRPLTVMEQFFEDNKNVNPSITENIIPKEPIVQDTEPSAEGIKIYDAVIPGFETSTQELESVENPSTNNSSASNYFTSKWIILSIWLTGALIVGGYVLVQNCKLRRKVNEMVIAAQVDGIDICVSKELKTPCLYGLFHPKIILTEEVLSDESLYEYAVIHELEHYHHKDHIYNADRICMCILYWWNPLVWYAAKCVAEDAELACDERVLKNKSLEERKKYGFALLQMIEYAQNKPLCMATSFSGNKNTAKQRIKAITEQTKTKKYILFPAALLLIIFLVIGGVYPSEKSYIKTQNWNVGETEEVIYNEANYEYSLQNDFQSMLIYYETYELGELKERTILSYGDLEKYSDEFLLREESYKFEEKHHIIFEMDGIEISMPIPQIDEHRSYAMNHLYCENELLEVKPNDDLILMAAYQEKDSEITKSLSCEILASYEENELKEVLGNHNVVTFTRLILSDLPSETLYDQMRKEAFPEMLALDEYNEKYSEKSFFEEPEKSDKSNTHLNSNTANASKIIKQAEERVREGYQAATLTYVDNAEVGWNYYTDDPWASEAEREELAQAALKELYTLTGFNVEECTYTTDGRSRFIFGKSASNIKKCIAFYSRDYGFTLCGDSTPYMGFTNARRFHYSDVQQLDSPYHKKEYEGNGAISTWFLEHSGVYQGEKIIGFDAINLDDTKFTHIKLIFDGGYYIVVMDEQIESFHEVTGPYFE